MHTGKKGFATRYERGIGIGQRIAVFGLAAARPPGAGRGGRHAMRNGETGFLAKAAEGPFGIKPQIACVRAHISRNEAWCLKGRNIGVFDRGDITRLDLQFALHVKKGFGQRRAFTAHDVAKAQVEVVEPLGFVRLIRRRR